MHEVIKQALDVLDLPTLVTRDDIKRRYRQLAREYHPDIATSTDKSMESINEAYEILTEYMDSFRYSFDDDEISKRYPDASHNSKFHP